MSRAEDNFTSTVDGAAAFERRHGRDDYDGPDASDLYEPDTAWEGEEDGEEHPPWCTKPPFHPPYWTGLRRGEVLVQLCEPEPSGG